MPNTIPFIPGQPQSKHAPLSRYLPPINQGVISKWLHQKIPNTQETNKRTWVIDPFGTLPTIDIEAARAGYCVLTMALNPINRFILKITAEHPNELEFKSALADFGATQFGGLRLKSFITALYETTCNHCKRSIIADAFVWDRDATGPSKRIYTCPYCGETGEFSTTIDDIKKAEHFSKSGLHHARALERVAPINDPDRPYVEEALSTYLPRSLYALFTIINILEGQPIPHKTLLQALILSACDKANTLWQYPTTRARPKQLTIPSHFYEYNIWKAMDEAISQWVSNDENKERPTPVTVWPDMPPNYGGICLYEGRLKDFTQNSSASSEILQFKAIISAIPRYNQAYWTFSALWAGWIWGHQASAPIKGVLRRKRYDWAWHTSALNTTFKALSSFLINDIPFLGLIGELEPSFLIATTVSSILGGFELTGLALRGATNQLQLHWQKRRNRSKQTQFHEQRNFHQTLTQSARQAAISYIAKRGEPTPFINLLASSLLSIVNNKVFDTFYQTAPSELYNIINELLQETFSHSKEFVRYGGSEHSLTTGLWWLSNDQKIISSPLIELIEKECFNFINSHDDIKFFKLDEYICEKFGGLFTPDVEVVKLILTSYADKKNDTQNYWELRPQDSLESRLRDKISLKDQIKSMGEKMGYGIKVENGSNISWWEMGGNLKYIFYIITSSTISEILNNSSYDPSKSLIILPGGRANLVAYKLNHNPYLRKVISTGWRFVKFRQIRNLAERHDLSIDLFEEQIKLDPLTYHSSQMHLL